MNSQQPTMPGQTEGEINAPSVDLANICFIVIKARTFDVKDQMVELE